MLLIDRFEGEFAVIIDDNDKCINIEKSQLPKEAKEGDVIFMLDGIYKIDYNKTQERKKRIEKLKESIWE